MSSVQPAEKKWRLAWPCDANAQALGLIAAFTLLRLLVCPFVGLGTNEAYAIASGRLMSLSYFDHPPLHFWLAHLGELIFGDTRYARIPFIVLGAGTSWLMFQLTKRLFGERAGVWAVTVLNLSIFFSLVSGNWILPDGPLNFFLLATALALSPLALGHETISAWRWLIAGLCLGLAALSKYHAFIFAIGFFLFLVTSPSGRRILSKPQPWLAALMALIVFLPVLYWNEQLNWISFRFQGGRAGMAHHIGFVPFLSLLAAQIFLLSPWIAPFLVQLLTRALRDKPDEQTRFLLWLGLPSALLFTLVPLWSDGGMVQWAMPGWLMLMPLLGAFLAKQDAYRRWPKIWIIGSAVAFGVFALLACAEIQTGWLGQAFPQLFRKGDPTIEYVEWTPLDAVARTIPQKKGQRWFVVAFSWRDAAKIDQAFKGTLPVLVVSDDPRNFALSVDAVSLQDWNALIIIRTPRLSGAGSTIAKCFLSTRPLTSIKIQRGFAKEATLDVVLGLHYMPSQCGPWKPGNSSFNPGNL